MGTLLICWVRRWRRSITSCTEARHVNVTGALLCLTPMSLPAFERVTIASAPWARPCTLRLSQVTWVWTHHWCDTSLADKSPCANPSSHRADKISRFDNVCVQSAVIIGGMMEISTACVS